VSFALAHKAKFLFASEKPGRPQSIRRLLTVILLAAVVPALIGHAYLQAKRFREVMSIDTQWGTGAVRESGSVKAPWGGDLAVGVGLILLGAAFGAGAAVRSGRVILRDIGRLRESVMSWGGSGTPQGQAPAPRIIELREIASAIDGIVLQRALMQEAARENERRWTELAEGMPQLLWTCLPEGACDFLSKQWVAHTGVPESKQLGYGWLEQVHPEDRNALIERWKHAVESGAPFDAQFRIRRHDGAYRWFKSRAVAVHDESGQTYKWYGTSNDIQHLRELQSALHESNERFRRALETIPDGVVIYNPDLRIQYVNEAFTRISGHPARHFIGRRDEEIWTPEVYGAYLPTLTEALEAQSVRSIGVDVLLEGQRIHTYVRFVPLTDDKGLVKEILAVIQDLTGRKQVEQALDQQLVALEIEKRLNAEKELLLHQEKINALTAELMLAEEQERRKIAIELHDRIGQNLAISKIKLGMALKSAPSGDLADALTEIRNFIEQTIEDTRSLSFELSPPALQDSDLNHALQDLVDYMQSSHGITIAYTWEGQAGLFEKSREVIIYMAVRELLLNIVKHSHASKASVNVRSAEDELRISVEDNGVCLKDPTDLQQNGKSKGFGLATMRERLAALSGTFNIDSCSGRGTRAVIILPLDSRNQQEA
jgi:PAS domain S-box-containing protein